VNVDKLFLTLTELLFFSETNKWGIVYSFWYDYLFGLDRDWDQKTIWPEVKNDNLRCYSVLVRWSLYCIISIESDVVKSE
jgi:hypothetical protein